MLKLINLLGTMSLSFTVAPMPAYAASWVFVDKSLRYFDADSMRRHGNSIIVWEKIDFSRDNSVSLRDMKVRQRYDCVRRTVTMIMWVDYFKDGSSKSREVPPREQMERQIIPDTPPEPILEAVCRRS